MAKKKKTLPHADFSAYYGPVHICSPCRDTQNQTNLKCLVLVAKLCFTTWDQCSNVQFSIRSVSKPENYNSKSNRSYCLHQWSHTRSPSYSTGAFYIPPRLVWWWDDWWKGFFGLKKSTWLLHRIAHHSNGRGGEGSSHSTQIPV